LKIIKARQNLAFGLFKIKKLDAFGKKCTLHNFRNQCSQALLRGHSSRFTEKMHLIFASCCPHLPQVVIRSKSKPRSLNKTSNNVNCGKTKSKCYWLVSPVSRMSAQREEKVREKSRSRISVFPTDQSQAWVAEPFSKCEGTRARQKPTEHFCSLNWIL